MIRTVAVLAVLCSPLAVWAEPAVPAAAAAGCTRASLQGAVDKYMEALKKGTPAVMPLATSSKYIENRKETPFGQGIWKEPLDANFHRSVFDVESCESFTEIIHASSTEPHVIGARLKVTDGKISEVENLITRKGDWLFNADNYLKYSSAEKWDILPPEKRSDRQTLLQAANAYFDVFNDYSYFDKIPWGTPCVRIEGGAYTNEKNDPNPSCTVGVPKQGGVKLVNRRFIVDVDMGTIVALADFGSEKGLQDSHMFRLESGKLRYVHTITSCAGGCPKIGPPPKPGEKPVIPQ